MLETSSIQELSNNFTLTRGEKIHSPHSSPRPLRKALPNIPSQSSASAPPRAETPHASTSNSTSVKSNSKSSSSPMAVAGCSGVSYQSSKNLVGIDLPLETSSPHSNKHHMKSQPSLDNAPPLPPRKNSPSLANADTNNVNRSIKPPASSPIPEDDLIELVRSPVHALIAAPPTASPRTTNANANVSCDFLTGDFDLEMDPSEIIVGKAETITGFIDTRPYDQRPFTSFAKMANSPATSINLITINDTEKEDKSQCSSDQQKTSNTYLLNNNFHNNNHQKSSTVKNPTIPQLPVKTKSLDAMPSNPTPTSCYRDILSSTSSSSSSSQDSYVQLYENVNVKSPMPSHRNGGFASQSSQNQSPQVQSQKVTTITSNLNNINLNNINNNGSSSASYENINLEYINKLMNDGYSKESVIKALGISGNNIEMASEILDFAQERSHKKASI